MNVPIDTSSSLIATVLVLLILGWILAFAGLVMIRIFRSLGFGLSAWLKPTIAVSSHPSCLSSQPRVTSVARGWLLEVGLEPDGSVAQQVSSHLASGSPVLLSRWLDIALGAVPARGISANGQPVDARGAAHGSRRRSGSCTRRRLEERIEEFNQIPPPEEPPQRSRLSPRSQESPPAPIDLHPNGAPQPLYLVKSQLQLLEIGEVRDGCR